MKGIPMLKRAATLLGAAALAGAGLLGATGTAYAEGPTITCQDAQEASPLSVTGWGCTVPQGYDGGPAVLATGPSGPSWQCQSVQTKGSGDNLTVYGYGCEQD
ncbi:hypothetical protein [Streptomyces sp. NPDC048157]|uniref:hypothetical protein n=1 Tax=Streptomyces sp. NPDC048157 TaxID=3365503 RepID=UPI003715E323